MTEKKGFAHEFKFDADGIGCAEGLDCKARDRVFLLELLINAIGDTEDAIGISDSFGAHIYHNKAYERLFGCNVAELNAAGGASAVLKRPEDAERIVAALKSGLPWSGEVEAHDLGDRRQFTTLLHANPVKDKGGSIIGFIGIHSDISERKRKENVLKLHRDLLMDIVEERTAEIEEANSKLHAEVEARKAAQDKLEAERSLFLAGPLAVIEWRLGPPSAIEYVSANFSQFGFPPETLLSGDIHFNDLVHPDDRQSYSESRAHVATSPFFALEYRLRTPRGKDIWVYEFTKVARDRKGRPVRLDSYLLDVTDRVNAEKELRSERDRTQSYLDLANTIFLVLGRDRKVRLINKKGCETLSLDESGIVGRDWFENFEPASHRKKDVKLFEDILAERVPLTWNVRYERPVKVSSGGERIVNWSFSLLKDRHGEPSELLACGEDVTEGRRTQESLKEASELLESLLKNSGAAILAIDSHSRLKSLNPAAERLFGWSLGDLESRADEIPHELTSTLKKISSESPGVSVRTCLPRKAGPDIDVAVTSIPCRLDSGKGAICMVTDVSQELALERHLRQTQKMEALGLLAGGIAHDFNNILSAIIGYTDLALLQSSPNPQVKSHLEQIAIAGTRARELVGQILAFCRKSDKTPEPVEASMIVKEAFKLLTATLPPSISIKEARRDRGEMIMAEPSQIHQMVSNLCTNASHAMKDTGGVITVSLSVLDSSEGAALPEGLPPGRYLELSVADKGHGIHKDILDRIFDPFFSTKRPGEGTGMGLSVVHGIVSDLKGKIEVETELGKGSVFRIFIPSAKKRARKEGRPPAEARRGSGSLLVVDDEAVLATMMAEMLGDLGYEAKSFSDPLLALDAFKSSPSSFDLLLTDQVMPVLTGAQLAIEVMKVRPDMPVVLLTGYGDRFTRDHALGVGIRKHLLKPVSMEELASAIHETLNESSKDKRS